MAPQGGSRSNNPKNAAPTVLKSTPKAKAGPTIMMPVKKMYCTKCQKLVQGKTQTSGASTQVVCPKCNLHLRVWNRLFWRTLGNGAD